MPLLFSSACLLDNSEQNEIGATGEEDFNQFKCTAEI